jgi:hypothetical protein
LEEGYLRLKHGVALTIALCAEVFLGRSICGRFIGYIQIKVSIAMRFLPYKLKFHDEFASTASITSDLRVATAFAPVK